MRRIETTKISKLLTYVCSIALGASLLAGGFQAHSEELKYNCNQLSLKLLDDKRGRAAYFMAKGPASKGFTASQIKRSFDKGGIKGYSEATISAMLKCQHPCLSLIDADLSAFLKGESVPLDWTSGEECKLN